MKKIVFIAIFLALWLSGATWAEDGRGVVIQVTDEQKLSMALTIDAAR